MTILDAKNLFKKFGNFIAVNNISFNLKEGEILGLLGPNGAGKTTVIQILLGVLTPTSGEVFYFDKNLKQHRSQILEKANFSSTYTNLPWDLTVWENLRFVSFLYNIQNRNQRLKRIIEIFQLEDIIKQRISELSAGQTTRVNLAKAFINFPKVLLLDEPTASLDPDVANYIRKFLLKERERFQVSIIFTSHNMAEVEEVCDRVVFINQGQIVANNTPENLAKTIELCHIQLLVRKPEALINFCTERGFLFRCDGKYIIVDVKEQAVAEFLQSLSAQKILYDEISIEKPSLEDYFLTQAEKK